MADKEISSLPKTPQITDDSLLPVYVHGSESPAQAATGKQFADFARNSVKSEVDKASVFATNAEKSAQNSQEAANRSEAARDSIILDEQKLSQAVQDAAGSAGSSLSEANRSKEEADRAERESNEAAEWANKAQGYAEQATVPAVAGVYNLVLADRVTGERYALIVESGRLKLLGVSDTLDAATMRLIDTATGVSYELIVESGRLKTLEVQ